EEKNLEDVAGYSPQDNALYPFLTIRENFEVFGKLRGVKKEVIKERMKNLLLDLGIYDARNKRVEELSGGMAKRADLAVTMLHDPKVIVLDEPFSGIDPPQRDIIWDALDDARRDGKIVILTSHMLPDLMNHCDEYGLVHRGEFHNTEEIKKIRDSTKYDSLQEMFRDVFRL
ncbi:MAG: ATP-binding cassette domain-containing protein, partial [Candidatus Aenigmatarchaeota archaeon]